MPNSIEKFEELPSLEKKVFILFLMYGLPASITEFLRLMAFADLKNPNTDKPLTAQKLGEIFQHLKKEEMINGTPSQKWYVVKKAQLLLKHESILESYNHWLPDIKALHVIQLKPYINQGWSYASIPGNYQKHFILHPFKLIIYDRQSSQQQRKEEFQKLLQIIEKQEHLIQYYCIDILELGKDPQNIWLLLTDKQKIMFFKNIRGQVLMFWAHIDILKQISENEMPYKCWISLAELYLLIGNTTEAENILSNHITNHLETSWVTSINGLCKYFKGDRKEAIELFELTLAQYKKETNKRKNYFPYTAGIFYVLAMMQEDFDKYRSVIIEFIVNGQKEQDIICSTYNILEYIFKEQDEDQDELSYLYSFQDYDQVSETLPDIIAIVIMKVWSNKTVQLKTSKQWSEIKEKLQKYNFNSILNHLLMLIDNKKDAVFARPNHDNEDWQRSLMRLEDLINSGNGSSAKKNSGTARLAWLVTYSDRFAEVQPKLQKSTKNGEWTKGRNVALKKLARGLFTEAELTPTDMKIISCIDAYSEYNGWGTETTYEVNADKAIPLLAGHHAVIAKDGRPVEITVTSPDLIVKKKQNENYLLTFSENIPPKPGNQIIKHTDHRIEVRDITKQHCDINKKIRKELTIPKEGIKQLQSLVPSLASLVPVQSDLAGDSNKLENIEANSTLQVHLCPADYGFIAEFLVEPIQKSGRLFHPGKGSEHILVEIGKNKVQTKRNLKKESKNYQDILSNLNTIHDMEQEPFRFYADNPIQCLELLDALKTCNPEKVNVMWPEGEKLRLQHQLNFAKLSVNIKKSGSDWFEVVGDIQIDDKTMMSMIELLDRVSQSQSRFLNLGDDDFLALEQSLFDYLKQLSAISQNGKVHKLASPILAEMGTNAGKLKSSTYWRDHQKKWENSFDKHYSVPTTLQLDLRDYQQIGFNWMARLSDMNIGACLADDMGLGKTIQTLAIMLSRAKNGAALVVAPVSVVPNWINEINKFAPTLNVIWMVGNSTTRKKALENLRPLDVVLCSYGVLVQDKENLSAIEWDMVVLDEAQAIKNHTTRRASTAFALNAKFKLATTGTPMENSLSDLWSIFKFITPGFLGSYDQFTQRFITPIETNNDSNAKQYLKNIIQPFILRRTKSQVLEELPPKTEITLNVEMNEQERAFYETLRNQAVENISTASNETQPTHIKILAEIMRLRRSCCHPKLIDEKININSSKLEQLIKLLTELRAGNHKVLIFSQFVGYLKLIREWLDKTDIVYQYLDGLTKVKDRSKAVQNFQNGEGDCFLISLKAGGSGLNLTAANYVIHMDPWWNPAVEDQASDRIHRIGQKQPVTIYRMVMKDTIEEKILALHKVKRDLVDNLLEGTDQIKRISTEELVSLLTQ